MAYCRECGQEIGTYVKNCPHCGASQQIRDHQPANDEGSFGWTVLGCCVPVVGLILWLVWREDKPNNAKAAGMGALIYAGFYAVMLLVGGCSAFLG